MKFPSLSAGGTCPSGYRCAEMNAPTGELIRQCQALTGTCTGDPNAFRMIATHAQGTKTCTYDSTLNPPLSCS